MKKYINKYSISFFVMFTIVMLCLSFIISISITAQYDMRFDNFLLTQDNRVLLINETNIHQEDLLNIIFSQPNIVIKGAYIQEDYKKVKGTLMYFNYKIDIEYPMIEGAFLTKEDCINKENVAVVGKNILDSTYIKDGKRYICVENTEYLVKGIMGQEKRSLKCDDMFILNESAYFKNIGESKKAYAQVISSSENTDNAVSNIIKELKKQDDQIKISQNSQIQFQSETVLFSMYELPKIMKSLIGVFLINIVIINVFWLISRKKELAIKKLLGASTMDIALSTMIYQQVAIILAYITAMFIHYALITYSSFSLLNYIGTQIDFISTVKTLFYGTFIGIIVNIPLILTINKIEPGLLIKRR